MAHIRFEDDEPLDALADCDPEDDDCDDDSDLDADDVEAEARDFDAEFPR